MNFTTGMLLTRIDCTRVVRIRLALSSPGAPSPLRLTSIFSAIVVFARVTDENLRRREQRSVQNMLLLWKQPEARHQRNVRPAPPAHVRHGNKAVWNFPVVPSQFTGHATRMMNSGFHPFAGDAQPRHVRTKVPRLDRHSFSTSLSSDAVRPRFVMEVAIASHRDSGPV